MTKTIQHQMIIPPTLAGKRLDQALAILLPEYSRTQIQEWITKTEIQLNHAPTQRRHILRGNEVITIEANLKSHPTFEAQSIALDVIDEDEALLIVNKPVGMVTHPGAGNSDNTLLNALLHHAPQLSELPRAGIIHRLDKNTSGLLVIAKSKEALRHLSHQIKTRSMSRHYQAIVSGLMISGGMVDAPIGRHPIQRTKMAVIDTGKPAITHYRVMERYRAHTRIQVQLETGRTHQIRVHMQSIHYPILGDPLYGARLQLPKGATPELIDALRHFKHQALHAYELGLIHPLTNQPKRFQAPLPEEMKKLINVLKEDHGV